MLTMCSSKRNNACEEAKGELIAHWDDDDWMASWRLTYQIEQLLAEQADITGLNNPLFYNPHTKQAWQYKYPTRKQAWLYGATFLYTKSLWHKNPFPDINVGEDTRFVWNQKHPKKILPLPDNTFLIALIHPGNTSPKRPAGARWQPYPTAEIEKLMADDFFIT